MKEVMLHGDLLESWKLWHKTKSEKDKEKEGTFKKNDIGEQYKKKYVEGYSNIVFKHCLWKVRNRFIKKYDTRG